MARKRIGETLLERGAITPEQLEAALVAQRQNPQQRVGAILVSQGAITEPMLVQALSEVLGTPAVDLATVQVDWAAVHLVRARFCEQHEVFPYAMENVGGRRHLVVAMADPLNQTALDELEFTTGLKVSPRAAALSGVRAAILRYYHKVAPSPAPGAAKPAAPTPPRLPRTPTSSRPALPAKPSAAQDDDEEVLVGEELPPAEKTGRTALADLIRKREEEQRQKRGGESKSRAGGSAVTDDLDYLFGGLREEPDRVEQLERKFWALMRIMARKGLLTNEEFTRELDDTES